MELRPRLVFVATFTGLLAGSGLMAGSLLAQAPGDEALKRLQGHWRIDELVENGRVIAPDQIAHSLPGGGTLEIIDNAIIFNNPNDGSKTARSLRIDPTSYPKQVTMVDRDQTTGMGIYEFDGDKLVVCLVSPQLPPPSDFGAPPNSGRMMMVLHRYEPDDAKYGPHAMPPLPQKYTSAQSLPNVANVSPQVANASAQIASARPIPGIASGDLAGRYLTDAEVARMLPGTWRINDGAGLIDIVVNGNGSFRSYREVQGLSVFHGIFSPTPLSAGNWTVRNNGQLVLTITSSTRFDRVNQTYVMAVRSISGKDLIYADQLGRVGQAVKVQ